MYIYVCMHACITYAQQPASSIHLPYNAVSCLSSSLSAEFGFETIVISCVMLLRWRKVNARFHITLYHEMLQTRRNYFRCYSSALHYDFGTARSVKTVEKNIMTECSNAENIWRWASEWRTQHFAVVTFITLRCSRHVARMVEDTQK
jgi:hypothetical protein